MLSGYSAPRHTPSSESPRSSSGSIPRPTVDPHYSARAICVVTRPPVVCPHCPIRARAPHSPLWWHTVPDTRSYRPSRGSKGKAVPNAACPAAQSPTSAVTAGFGWSPTHPGDRSVPLHHRSLAVSSLTCTSLTSSAASNSSLLFVLGGTAAGASSGRFFPEAPAFSLLVDCCFGCCGTTGAI